MRGARHALTGFVARAALAAVCAAASIAHAGTVRHALLVGVNKGGGNLDPLAFAETDAEKMSGVLVELGEFDEEFVTVLYSPGPDMLREALAHHATVAESYDDDLFLFYYSGHADAQGLRLGEDRYFFESLKHDLRSIDSGVRIGILDACRSGTITRLKGAAITQSMFGSEGTATEGEAWLTASAPDELAQESDTLRGGFFTHYLISGMRGAADTNDGRVDLEELWGYTRDRVVASTGATSGGTQHPHFERKLSGSDSVELTDLGRASALIGVPPGVAGHISVLRLPERTQIAEFAKRSDLQMRIAVPGGRYLMRRRDEGALFEVSVGVNDGGQVTVDEWGNARLELTTARGGEDERLTHFLDQSRQYERKLNLGASPVVAGGASLVIPGAGQFYNRQYLAGSAYFLATSGLLAGALFQPQDTPASAFWPAVGVALWGASVADAAYNVHKREESRPIMGGQIAWSLATGGEAWPIHTGFSADVMLRRGLSIGLDRIGYTPFEDGYDLHAGSRLMVGMDNSQRFRAGALVGFGIRHGQIPGTQAIITRTVFSAGGNLRYYFVPRYFAEVDLRWENEGDWNGIVSGVSMGVHLGR